MQKPFYILTISCPDRIGIVAEVAGFLRDHRCNITDSAQFGDVSSNRFFMRVSFASETGARLPELESAFAIVAERFGMKANFYDATRKVRSLILVSKFGHCLVDLIYRQQTNALNIEIPRIVSNHQDFAPLVKMHNIAFSYLPVSSETRKGQEEALAKIISDEKIDLVILARYMQILSPDFIRSFGGRIINIHHSFLPSFKGARPYHRAHERGVKLIGATAHYVTEEVDEGPIIEQAVERVTHVQTPEEFVTVGRDVERIVLARAVKWHSEHRTVLNGGRTVVFA